MQDFCLARGFDDGVLVREDKLILWLDDVVLKRTVRKRRKIAGGKKKEKRRKTADESAPLPTASPPPERVSHASDSEEVEDVDSDSETELGIKAETVEGWVSAVCNLYHEQVCIGLHLASSHFTIWQC